VTPAAPQREPGLASGKAYPVTGPRRLRSPARAPRSSSGQEAGPAAAAPGQARSPGTAQKLGPNTCQVGHPGLGPPARPGHPGLGGPPRGELGRPGVPPPSSRPVPARRSRFQPGHGPTTAAHPLPTPPPCCYLAPPASAFRRVKAPPPGLAGTSPNRRPSAHREPASPGFIANPTL